ncbi:MAG: energy transducer TonB [Bacteroidota bacterium]
MANKLTLILLIIPFLLHGQAEVQTIEEVVILPEFTFGTYSIYIKANQDSSFQYNILDMENNHTLMTGKVSSLEPLIRSGSYRFNTPEGEPYANGSYSNNIPFRIWNYFDTDGQVIASLNYSATLQFLMNFGDIEIGDDFVYQARKAPKFGRKGMGEFIGFIKENAVYPPFPLINNEEGKVVCQFVIDKSGQMINARIVEGVNEDLDLEVLRVLSLSPLWKPGKIKGDPVNVMYRLAVHFKMP